MAVDRKTEQLQIRVSPAQKAAIKARARGAGMTVSEWVLDSLFPSSKRRFQELVAEIAASDVPGYPFAELLDLLESLEGDSFVTSVEELPQVDLDDYWGNYLAATVEHAAALKGVRVPAWTREIPPLEEPVFGSRLASLRLHLLLSSPPAFNRRNIFIDATVGDRV